MRISRFALFLHSRFDRVHGGFGVRPSAVEIRGKIHHGLQDSDLRLLRWLGRAPGKKWI